MPVVTDVLDLGGLRLSAGEGRRFELSVRIEPLTLGGERYAARPAVVPVRLDVSRMTGNGYALRLRFDATLSGPCMRCLKDAAPVVQVQAREADALGGAPRGHAAPHGAHAGRAGGVRLGGGQIPSGVEELSSPYVQDEALDLARWARDALALALPAQVLCREDCAGLCAVCAADLNEVGPEHAHERAPDPRWAKLSELKLE